MKIDLTYIGKSQLDKLQQLVASITAKVDTAYLFCTGIRKAQYYCRYLGSENEQMTSCHIELLLVCKIDSSLDLGHAQLLANDLSSEDFSCVIVPYEFLEAEELIKMGDRSLTTAINSGALLYQYNIMLSAKRGYSCREDILATVHNCWSRGFGNACKFMDCAFFCIAEGNYDMATFMTHQAVEHTCKALLHCFTQDCPQTHNLSYLLRRCACFHPDILQIFAKNCPQDNKLMKQLKRSYIDCRYSTHFKVKEAAVWEMADRACQLQNIATELYHEQTRRLSCLGD
ncbi:HEPN domain-containing protein [Olivibacter sitiensis]|uniref:HEPN domain-containing protein n=1 Tax=Olivibacter sitiensis TaxID=376470 RepID=UPI000489308C|nr:HEPN domain-containing protein [Olivibacter sitiensis]